MERYFKTWQYFVEVQEEALKSVGLTKRDFEEGDSIDELWALKFLEGLGRVMTAMQFRNEFREIDVNYDKKMSFLEYLLWDSGFPHIELFKKPQASSPELEAAIAEREGLHAEIETIETKRKELERLAETGTGVKARLYKSQLNMLMNQDNSDLFRRLSKADRKYEKAKAKLGTPPGELYWAELESKVITLLKPQSKY